MKYIFLIFALFGVSLSTIDIYAAQQTLSTSSAWTVAPVDYSKQRIPGVHSLAVTHNYPIYFWRSVTCDNNRGICSGINYLGEPYADSVGYTCDFEYSIACWYQGQPPGERLVTVPESAIKAYKYDPYAPSCAHSSTMVFYNASTRVEVAASIAVNRWNNSITHVRVKCADSDSGCTRESTDVPVSHFINSVTIPGWFQDIAGNSTTTSGTLNCSFPSRSTSSTTPARLLMDRVLPAIESIKIDGTNNAWFVAGSRTITYTALDESSDNYGVSGITNIKTEVKRIKNTYKEDITPTRVCYSNTDYPAYNPDGNITTSDVKNIEVVCNDTSGIQIAGTYSISIQVTDAAGNVKDDSREFLVVPSTIDTSKANLQISSNIVYANAQDKLSYTMQLMDRYSNPIWNAPLYSVGQAGTKKLFLNEITKSGESAEIYTNLPERTGRNWELRFDLGSYAPGLFNHEFTINTEKWDTQYAFSAGRSSVVITNGQVWEFRKLFTGALSIENGQIMPGTSQIVTLAVNRAPTPVGNIPTTNAVVQYNETMRLRGSGVALLTKNLTNGSDRQTIVQTSQTAALLNVWVETQPHASYTLSGKQIVAYITTTDNDFDPNSTIWFDQSKDNRIFIEGAARAQWDATLVGKDDIFETNIGTAQQSNLIRKNLYTLTRGMNNGQTVDGVKFIKGNATLSWENFPETIIVIGGDIIINGDINKNGKKFGIAALADDAGQGGNIYINSNVGYVGLTALYADKSIFSSNTSGVAYAVSNTSRSNELNKQLVLRWAFFSRNTIGWATGNGGSFKLPRSETTTDLNEAVKYDLSFLRMRNTGWDDPLWTKNLNKWRSESVVILRAPEAVTTPPKGFSLR